MTIMVGYILYLFTYMSISDFFMRATFSSNQAGNQTIELLIEAFRNGIALICSLVFVSLYKKVVRGYTYRD